MLTALHFLNQFDAVHFRHTDVGKHHVDLLLFYDFKRSLSIVALHNDLDRYTTSHNHCFDSLTDHFLIFNDQNCLHNFLNLV